MLYRMLVIWTPTLRNAAAKIKETTDEVSNASAICSGSSTEIDFAISWRLDVTWESVKDVSTAKSGRRCTDRVEARIAV